MRQLIKGAAAALLCTQLCTGAAAITHEDLDFYQNYYTRFSSQEHCIKAVTAVDNAYMLLKDLNPQGWITLKNHGLMERSSQQRVRREIAARFSRAGGINEAAVQRLMRIRQSIDAYCKGADGTSKTCTALTADQIDKCYDYYHEFPYDEGRHVEIVEQAMGDLPQDPGWDFFVSLPILMEYDGIYLQDNPHPELDCLKRQP